MAKRGTYIKLQTTNHSMFFQEGEILDGRKRNGLYQFRNRKTVWLELEDMDDGLFQIKLCDVEDMGSCDYIEFQELQTKHELGKVSHPLLIGVYDTREQAETAKSILQKQSNENYIIKETNEKH